jgi:hypothetical protein
MGSSAWSGSQRQVSPFAHLSIAVLFALPAPACGRSDVLGGTAALAVDEALRATILLPKSGTLPDLWTATLDEVLAIRVLVDHELDGSVTPDAAAVTIHEPVDRCLDFTPVLAAAVLYWRVKE